VEDGPLRREWRRGLGHSQGHRGSLASVSKFLLLCPLLCSVTSEELHTSVHRIVLKSCFRLGLFWVNTQSGSRVKLIFWPDAQVILSFYKTDIEKRDFEQTTLLSSIRDIK